MGIHFFYFLGVQRQKHSIRGDNLNFGIAFMGPHGGSSSVGQFSVILKAFLETQPTIFSLSLLKILEVPNSLR